MRLTQALPTLSPKTVLRHPDRADEFSAVREALERKNAPCQQVEMLPQNYVTLNDEELKKNMSKLIELLEDNDDVQQLWHNWEDE